MTSDRIKTKLVCIKSYKDFTRGEQYEYWTNFGGLNHFVKDNSENIWVLDGDESREAKRVLLFLRRNKLSEREYIWDYFTTINNWRDEQLNKIITDWKI